MASFLVHGKRLALVIAPLLLFTVSSFAQTPACSFNAAANTVHQEGLAERVGDMTVTCTGGTPGATVSENLFITLNANITNKLDSSGNPFGITVTNGGSAAGSFHLSSSTTLVINSLNYTVPSPASTPVIIIISGLRVGIASLSNGTAPSVVSASIVGVGAQFPPGQQVVVAVGSPTLLQSTVNNGVPCSGSALPTTLDFPTFTSTSTSSTVRITEASVSAFAKAQPGDDNGTRILVNLTGYGSGSRVFVPDAIVGNSGTLPTSSGGFASSIAAGTYTPASSQLLLIRVNGADVNGAGGTLALAQPGAATTFSSVSEIAVTGGNAYAVYEVVDSNPAVVESAQFPAFVVVNPTSCPSTLVSNITAKLAPVSTVSIATATDPVPRFLSVNPISDCTAHGDCNASYFPNLSVDTTPIVLTGSSLGGVQSAFIKVGNTGSGILNFTTSIVYQSGSNWLSVSPSSGSNNASLQVIADPSTLAPGTYTATVTVSAGNYGTGMVPVTFTVGPVGVTIQNVGNAASFQYGTLSAGSYAVLFGLNLAGKNVSVTFNGLPATIVFDSANQINLIVPAALGAQQGALVVATVDGLISNSFRVNLILNSPGIFTPGIVNFADGSINGAAHPVTRGTFATIYLTGLTIPITGQVTVNIGSQTNLIPSFAGAQPTLPALDQVNIVVPSTLPATPNPVPVQVCIPGSTGQQVCSNQVNLYIQ